MWDAETKLAERRPGLRAALPHRTLPRRFETPDRRFHFKADWKRFGGRWAEMPALPDHFDVIDRATAAKPYRLVAAPARTFLNSTFTETPGSLRRECGPPR
jgi:hypothetical protein